MKLLLWLLIASIGLSIGCKSGSEYVGPSAPYDDINPVPPERFSRRYLQVLAASPWWHHARQNEVFACGALGNRAFKPGITVKTVVTRLCGTTFVPSFYNIAIWRPSTAALYGVRFPEKHSIEPSVRTLKSSDPLLPGDVIIILEKMVCF